jgi:hypothetical protein
MADKLPRDSSSSPRNLASQAYRPIARLEAMILTHLLFQEPDCCESHRRCDLPRPHRLDIPGLTPTIDLSLQPLALM